jgi:hypothetical protein
MAVQLASIYQGHGLLGAKHDVGPVVHHDRVEVVAIPAVVPTPCEGLGVLHFHPS